MTARIILVGVGGFGAHHLVNIARLEAENKIALVAMVDPFVNAQRAADSTFVMPHTAPLFNLLAEALAAVGCPDVVIVSVPIHLHAPITKEALLAGADVLLEKPPFACLQDFEEVVELERKTGRVVQVGFQSIGSLAIDAMRRPELGLGKIKAVRATGKWLRRAAYWKRSPWVGKRSLGDIYAMDGVATNALAHAVETALHVAGITEAEQVEKVEVEAYRAQAIDTDDTVSLRVTSPDGTTVVAALTLCASEQVRPKVEVVGENGTAVFGYVDDEVEINGEIEKYGRTNMLENLVEHRLTGERLRLPLRSTGSFMRVLDAIRLREPQHIERKYIDVRETGDESHPVIQDIEDWVAKAALADSLFSEVGAPWAFTGRDSSLAQLKLGDKVLMDVQNGQGTAPTSTPRPYYHPVRTLSGIEVTSTHPSDHDWHCGLGFAVPDVDGTSFWGGGTYIHGQGYVLLDNHGHIESESIQYLEPKNGAALTTAGLDHQLVWSDHKSRQVIREHQTIRCSTLNQVSPSAPSGWLLLFQTDLHAIDGAVSLGSPGSNGRVGGGYGGFFWRLPRCVKVDVFSADAEGEDAVHGSVSPWIAWTGRFEARPGVCGNATLIFVPADERSAQDPWVVRYAGYPGVGSAVAWDQRVEIPNGDKISRSFKVAVLDGLVDKAGAAKIASEIRCI